MVQASSASCNQWPIWRLRTFSIEKSNQGRWCSLIYSCLSIVRRNYHAKRNQWPKRRLQRNERQIHRTSQSAQTPPEGSRLHTSDFLVNIRSTSTCIYLGDSTSCVATFLLYCQAFKFAANGLLVAFNHVVTGSAVYLKPVHNKLTFSSRMQCHSEAGTSITELLCFEMRSRQM